MSDSISNELVPVEITVETLKAKIYTVRGQRVMLASDLAEIYGYTTKAFNQQVKNNIEKFDEDFRFQITREELDDLVRSKNFTLNKDCPFKEQVANSMIGISLSIIKHEQKKSTTVGLHPKMQEIR